jgi:hypothetical protein
MKETVTGVWEAVTDTAVECAITPAEIPWGTLTRPTGTDEELEVVADATPAAATRSDEVPAKTIAALPHR